MRKAILSQVLVIIIIFFTKNVFAVGALFTRPLRSNHNYEKMWIKSVDATFTIEGQVAVTHVDQVFQNEMNELVEGIYIFPLPEGAVITDLYYWFNGIRYKASIRERQQAINDYNNRVRDLLDPALLEYLGNNLFRLSIAPINANSDVRTEITYVEMLPYEFGAIDYTFLLNSTGLSSKPLRRVSVTGELNTQDPIKYLVSSSQYSPTEMKITRISETRYTIVFGDENFLPDADLTLEYETERARVTLNVLTYTPTPADSIGSDSFYAIWIVPPDSIAGEDVIPKKIIFTADVSSSMDGLRIDQLKEGLIAFLDHLAPEDKFNIVTFGTTVVPYKPDLVPASVTEITAAKQFVTALGAAGLTNISEALTASLTQSFSDDCANMIVFFTDGYPTWGETSIPKILTIVAAKNTHNVSIFPFGVGEDISKMLLVQLALENNGYHTFIETDADIARVVANHFNRISRPVLTSININLEGLVTLDNFPRPIPDLFWGNQVTQLGLYKNAGTFPAKITGLVRTDSICFETSATFDRTEGQGHRFISRLWAREKIDYLLGQIEIYGKLDELVNQVIDLSLRFQILTPYTAFYSDPTKANDLPQDQQPESFALFQNYPNPFNPETTIRYAIPASGYVVLKIYDITGRLIKIATSKSQQAGLYTIKWDGTDAGGFPVAAGIYIYRLEFTGHDGQTYMTSRKMTLIR